MNKTFNDIRILKTFSCPSLSGKSQLRFELGCTGSGDLQVRICANSAAGYFNADWLAWAQLVHVLDRHGEKPITSHTLGPLFKGRSANSAGFLLAGLKHEGLIQRVEGNSRCYERMDGTAFNREIQLLMHSSPGATSKAVKAAKAVNAVAKGEAVKVAQEPKGSKEAKVVALPRTAKTRAVKR